MIISPYWNERMLRLTRLVDCGVRRIILISSGGSTSLQLFNGFSRNMRKIWSVYTRFQGLHFTLHTQHFTIEDPCWHCEVSDLTQCFCWSLTSSQSWYARPNISEAGGTCYAVLLASRWATEALLRTQHWVISTAVISLSLSLFMLLFKKNQSRCLTYQELMKDESGMQECSLTMKNGCVASGTCRLDCLSHSRSI